MGRRKIGLAGFMMAQRVTFDTLNFRIKTKNMESKETLVSTDGKQGKSSKKPWKAPEMIVLDINETEAGASGGGNDGGGAYT